MQIFLNKLKCNDEIDFVYKTEYSKNLLNCESINFGPLSEILVFKSNIWVTTLVVAFFFFFMVLIYWFKYIENQKIYYFLFVYFLSPPSLMLFESLNPDIIYLIFFWTLYQKNIELWNCMGFSHNDTDPIKDLYCWHIGRYNPVKYFKFEH